MIDAILIPFQNFLYPTFFFIRIEKKKRKQVFRSNKGNKEKEKGE